MKDLSFFLLKNHLGSRMKKGFKTFCNGDGSTSTFNQRTNTEQRGDTSSCTVAAHSQACSPFFEDPGEMGGQPTLEEMILGLELEERMARRAKLQEQGIDVERPRRVNSPDILRSARSALNQYPRFSLDGKDAMYRASFRNFDNRHVSACKEKSLQRKFPEKVTGESVVWCKPGAVAKLMELEAVPIPTRKERLSSVFRKQNLRRTEREETERRRLVAGRYGTKRGGTSASCSTAGYCAMKQVKVDLDEVGWPMRHFL